MRSRSESSTWAAYIRFVRLELDLGQMFEMFGLAEEFPVLERP